MFILPLLLLGGSFVLALVLCRLLIAAGPRLGVMDQPDERRVHCRAVPRAGGLAVWLGFGACALLLIRGVAGPPREGLAEMVTAFFAASALLVAVGVADDRGGIRPWAKLGGQMVASAVYWWLKPGSGTSLMGYQVPWLVDLGIWVGWIVLLINAFNLIDGLDGLCGGLAAISLTGMAAIQLTQGHPGEALLLGLMVAALAGFLWYNRHPARIFLGDAGSMMLGLFVATAATEVVGRKTVGAGLLLPLAVAGVPLMDVLLAVWRRAVRKRLAEWRGGEGGGGIFSPDKDHLHHRLLARGWSQARVTRVLHGAAVVLSLLALAPLLLGGRGVVLTVVGGFVIALFGLRHLASVEFVQSGNLLRLAVKRRQGSRGWRACYFFWDLLVLPLAALAGVLLDTNFGRREAYSAAPGEFVVLFTVAGLVMLRLLKVYRRLWSRARLREFLLVAAGLGVAGLATAALVQVVAGDLTWRMSRITLTATVLAVAGVLIPRSVPELLRELAVDSGHRQRQELAGGRRRLLVYGAGDLGSLYLDHLAGIPPAHFERVQVIGFIDDKRLLKGRLLRGFEIFGTLEDLPGLSRELRLDGVVLAIRELDEVKRARLQAILTEAGLESLEWDLILRGDEVRPGPADGIEVA